MLKGRPCGDVHGTDNQLGQGKRSLYGPIFPTSRAILARVTPPTSYYRQLAGSAANFALGTKGLPKGHRDQSGITKPVDPFTVFLLFLPKLCPFLDISLNAAPRYTMNARGSPQADMVLSESPTLN